MFRKKYIYENAENQANRASFVRWSIAQTDKKEKNRSIKRLLLAFTYC